MEKVYPYLFPVFRDEFIPHLMAKIPSIATEKLRTTEDIEIIEKHLPELTDKLHTVSYVKTAAKTIGTLIPTNLDNLVIADLAGEIAGIVARSKGATDEQSKTIKDETFNEVSGFASVGRSIDAGKDGNVPESIIQAADALGIPIPALMQWAREFGETKVGKAHPELLMGGAYMPNFTPAPTEKPVNAK